MDNLLGFVAGLMIGTAFGAVSGFVLTILLIMAGLTHGN